MKSLKKYMALLLALLMCLSMAACGEKEDVHDEDVIYNEDVSYDGDISIEDLEGFWYPLEGLGSTMSVLTCIYLDGAAETWEEYDEYGDPTGYTGGAYTDGSFLTLTDVPLIGDVEIPIGDANTLVDETGEPYWIKGEPDYKEKLGLSNIFGQLVLQGRSHLGVPVGPDVE